MERNFPPRVKPVRQQLYPRNSFPRQQEGFRPYHIPPRFVASNPLDGSQYFPAPRMNFPPRVRPRVNFPSPHFPYTPEYFHNQQTQSHQTLHLAPPFIANQRPSLPLPRRVFSNRGRGGMVPRRERAAGIPKQIQNRIEHPMKKQRMNDAQVNGWQDMGNSLNPVLNSVLPPVTTNYTSNPPIIQEFQNQPLTETNILEQFAAILENANSKKNDSDDVLENIETLQKISEILTASGIDISTLNLEAIHGDSNNSPPPEVPESEYLLRDVDLLKNLDLSEPVSCETGWNASEIIKNFLYIGSGYDRNQRCLVNNPYKLVGEDRHLIEREKFVKDKNIKFFLNMAGHPEQQELRGITYPGDAENNQIKSIELNDVDSWGGQSMEEALEEGANFIQQAYYVHIGFTKLLPAVERVKILVHCVAGVNRSAFVVVWWLVKYHGLFLKDAWNLVVERRDSGVNWLNQTLGGEVEEEIEEIGANIEKYPVKFYTRDPTQSGKSKHQYLVEATVPKPSKRPLHHHPITLELLNDSGEEVIFATSDNTFPKYFWYHNAKRLLCQYFTAHYP